MDDEYSNVFSDEFGYPVVRVYSLVSTKIVEHSNHISLFSNITKKSNMEIEKYKSTKNKWKYIKNTWNSNNYNSNFSKLPFEIMSYIGEFLDERLSSKEINWVLNKSYVNLPFECLLCSNLMKLKFKSFKGFIWYYCLMYKNKYCDKCCQIKELEKSKYKE